MSRLLNGRKELPERRREIEALYSIFGDSADLFRSAEIDEIVMKLRSSASADMDADGDYTDELTKRVELLASLMYVDFRESGLGRGLQMDIAAMALRLYTIADEHSTDYSVERAERMSELRRTLNEFSV